MVLIVMTITAVKIITVYFPDDNNSFQGIVLEPRKIFYRVTLFIHGIVRHIELRSGELLTFGYHYYKIMRQS